jgi:hypothetical protein
VNLGWQNACHNKTVVGRLDRAIQYAAASRLNRWRLWNTGSPGPVGRMTAVFVRTAPTSNSISQTADTRPYSRSMTCPRFA